jgi:hypothetical protein
MKSYKTTLAGVIAAIATYLAKDASISPSVQQIAEIVGVAATASLGFFARDNNVSSENAGAK